MGKQQTRQELKSSRRWISNLFVSGIVVVVGTVTLASYWVVRDLIARKLEEQAILSVERTTHEVDQLLATLLAQVEAISNNQAVRSLNWSIAEPYLQLEIDRLPDIYAFIMAQPDGSYYTTKVGFAQGKNIRDRQHFQAAMAGKTIVADPVFSRSTGIHQVNIAAPIWSVPPLNRLQLDQNAATVRARSLAALRLQKDFQPQPIGELSAAIAVSRLTTMITQLNFGKGSYAFALDSQGIPITHPNHKLVEQAKSLKNSEIPGLVAIVHKMVSGLKGIELVQLDPQQEPVYITYAPLEKANWSMALVIPRATLEQPLISLNFLAVAIGGLLIVMIIAWNKFQAFQQGSEERFQATFEQAAVGICHCDLNGQFLRVNQKLCEIVGYTAEELLAKTFEDITHPDDIPANLEQIHQLLNQQSTNYYIEKRYIHKNGELIWIAITISLANQDMSHFAKKRQPYLIAVIEDITERKQAEVALKQSEIRLRELLQRENLLNQLGTQIRNSLDLNTILQTTVSEIRALMKIERCLFLWVRPHGECPHTEVVFEAKDPLIPSQKGSYSFQQVGGFAKAFLKLETIRCDDINTLKNSAMQSFLQELDYKSLLCMPLKTPGGDVGVVSCGQHSEIRNWQDREVELLQMVLDQLAIAIGQADLYAETRETARQFQTQAQELSHTLHELQHTQSQLIHSEKMSSLGQMVAGIAHEINNPVSFIYGNIHHARDYSEALLEMLQLYQNTYSHATPEIEALAEKIDLDFLMEDLPKILTSMEVGAERIQEIVLSLRNFSRLDEGEMKAVDIHQGIDSTLMILNNRLKAQPDRPAIQILKQYGQVPLVECYAGQLNQVFMNLLVNGIDALEDAIAKGQFSQQPDQVPTIKIVTEFIHDQSPDSNIIIRILDNGPGIPEGVQQRLFDPFFTTKPVGKGTGLGLSISYQIIVEKHRGKLKCLSQVGQGTEFVIEIPGKFEKGHRE